MKLILTTISFNILHVDSHYYTDDQFNRKCHTNADTDNFALIHYNCRSLAKNFAMIRDHITSLDSMTFDVIALSETWLNDDNNDSFNLDGYDLVSCSRRSKKGGGVGLYIRNSMQHKYRCISLFCQNVLLIGLKSSLQRSH